MRRFNQNRRDIITENCRFEVVGKVLFIGKARDSSGNWRERNWKVNDNVVVGFVAGKREYYRGLISAAELVLCGFTPVYGQTYRFATNTTRQKRENYTLMSLSGIFSV